MQKVFFYFVACATLSHTGSVILAGKTRAIAKLRTLSVYNKIEGCGSFQEEAQCPVKSINTRL